MSPNEARRIIEQLVETVHGWRGHFAAAGCPETELRALEPFFAYSKNRL